MISKHTMPVQEHTHGISKHYFSNWARILPFKWHKFFSRPYMVQWHVSYTSSVASYTSSEVESYTSGLLSSGILHKFSGMSPTRFPNRPRVDSPQYASSHYYRLEDVPVSGHTSMSRTSITLMLLNNSAPDSLWVGLGVRIPCLQGLSTAVHTSAPQAE